MTKLAIAAVEACAPKPFTATPFLELTLVSQVGTTARYIQTFPADTSMEQIDGEARALELAGEIDQAALGADWRIDQEAIAAEEAQIEGDAEEAAFDSAGPDPVEIEVFEEVEPLV